MPKLFELEAVGWPLLTAGRSRLPEWGADRGVAGVDLAGYWLGGRCGAAQYRRRLFRPAKPLQYPFRGWPGQCPALVRVASNAAWVRLATFRRLMICLTCALTVLSDMFSPSAINLLDLPSEISAKTSR
jgi:hypothetical protein